MSAGVDANPFIAIALKVEESGVVKIVYEDNKGGKWERTADTKATWLVQESNRMLAEGINPGEVWYEVGKDAIKKYNLDKCDLGLGPGVFKGAAAQLPREVLKFVR